MPFEYEDRLSGHSDDERQPLSNEKKFWVDNPLNVERRRAVKQQLSILGPKFQEAQIEIAVLLSEAHKKQYWRHEHESFKSYVQEIAGISLRTAQELLRVIRICQAVNLSTAEISRLGWSKLAVVAKHLTPDNAINLLSQVEQSSYSQLKNYFTKTGENQKTNPKKRPSITFTQVIEEALRLACAHTHSIDVQPNLEFVAQKFLELIEPPTRIPRIDHPN